MFERLLGPKHCKVHNCLLERDSVPVHYGLIRFREEYRHAQRDQFPHSKKFVLGGCRLGPRRKTEVLFCPACRTAETRWHEENPDYDDPSKVVHAISTARRELDDSLAKRLLKQSQLERPERVGRFVWVVYRLNLNDAVAYNSQHKTYIYPYGSSKSKTFADIDALSNALMEQYDL